MMLPSCYCDVTRLLLGCYWVVTVMLLNCYWVINGLLLGLWLVLTECLKVDGEALDEARPTISMVRSSDAVATASAPIQQASRTASRCSRRRCTAAENPVHSTSSNKTRLTKNTFHSILEMNRVF